MDKFLTKRRGDSDLQQLQPAQKKSKPLTKFSSSHSKEFPCFKASHKGETFAFCTACNVDISIGSGGKDDLNRHVQSVKHTNAYKEKSSGSSQSINNFFSKGDDLSVIRSEVKWTQFLIEKGLPLSTSDDFSSLIKELCPDSEVAKKFSCKRTKTRALVGCIGNAVTKELSEKMKTNHFSLGTDGSNDHHCKLYPVVITINDEACGEIRTELLSIPELTESSPAVNITKLLVTELEKFNVPLKNCVAFMSDNASVMVGVKGGVSTLLKKEQPNMMSLGCACHLINLAVKKSVSCLPIKIDEVLTDVYYYFHHSEKRICDFKEVQLLYNEEAKDILKHCPTRWLSLTTSLKRIVQLWQPLCEYFKSIKHKEEEALKKKTIKQQPQDASDAVIDSWFHDASSSASTRKSEHIPPAHSRLDRLVETFCSKRCLVYSSFLLWIMPLFDKYNKLLQKEEPQIHKLNDIYLSLFRDLLAKFVKPTIIQSHTNILLIDFHNEKHHITDKDMYIGELAQGLIADMKAKNRSQIHMNIIHFYTSSLTYIKDKFPLNSDILKHAKFVDIERRDKVSFADVQFFFKKFTVPKCSMDTLHEEFVNFQSSELPSTISSETRCDRQWNILLNHRNHIDQTKPYENLARLALSVLTIPHSNAAAERIFSFVRKNRTESRSLMSTDTLSTLLVTKVRASCHRPIKLTDDFLKKCKRATMDSLHSSHN